MSIGENPKIGFLGHTDTVEYIEGWNTNPFELSIVEDKIFGLGVCDMKGGIAAILDAISKIDFNKLQYGVKLYFTYDEEIGFGGIYYISFLQFLQKLYQLLQHVQIDYYFLYNMNQVVYVLHQSLFPHLYFYELF